MRRSSFLLLGVACCLAAQSVQAQTSYPMLMSLKPVAAQVGQTSEHELNSRYDLSTAYQVLVEGSGVTGEVVKPEVKVNEGEKPNVTKLKLRFTVTPDALPGVRDFRVVTANGASTLGQLVVVRDPVLRESGDNNAPAKAQEVAIPAVLCGTIEKAEDVDYFRFQVPADKTLVFHVRAMRLEDKIHDLQTHVDPIITLRSASGSTLATSDNHFFADPFLAYHFEQAGEYLLELRDVRYQGNQYWEYCVEVNDRPFVTAVHPLAIAPGAETTLHLSGVLLPNPAIASVQLPADHAHGPTLLPLTVAGQTTDPTPLFVTDLPIVLEAETPNTTAAEAQSVTVPTVISGRVESDSDMDCYAFEAKKGEQFAIEVQARRLLSELDSVVRVLDANGKQLVENDDLRLGRHTAADSWIENWQAPADGKYVIEIRDLHLRGGADFPYVIQVTKAEPYFELFIDTDKTALAPGAAGAIFVRAERKNGFTGEIQLDIAGLPETVTAASGRIPPEKAKDGCIVLQTTDPKLVAANVTVTGKGTITEADGGTRDITAVAVPYQEIYQPGGGRGHWPTDMHTVAVCQPRDITSVKLSDTSITLKPGESKKLTVTIERAEGFKGNVTLDFLVRHLNSVFADPLPPGVSIDAKNSKTLLTTGQTEGYLTLKADKSAQPVEGQLAAVMADVAINFVMKGTYCSPPLSITVEKAE